ncbi:MAG TPA: hypothetical protein ENK14_13500 [Caldithrix sp.]|nr:hypothetical protein [Caldithrix sp.]
MFKHVLFVLFFLPVLCFAQDNDLQPIHTDEYGAGITVAMSGFGLGGFYRVALPGFFYLGANLDFYMMRDEKEFSYYDPYYGVAIEANKFNRLFFIPFSVELKRRLFHNMIEENFRPYLIALTGVTFGMNFPRDNNFQFQLLPPEEQKKYPRDDEYRFTFNFALGFGIDFSTQKELFISIRPQYRFTYFPKSIAGKNNHSSFEIRLEIARRKL